MQSKTLTQYVYSRLSVLIHFVHTVHQHFSIVLYAVKLEDLYLSDISTRESREKKLFARISWLTVFGFKTIDLQRS